MKLSKLRISQILSASILALTLGYFYNMQVEHKRLDMVLQPLKDGRMMINNHIISINYLSRIEIPEKWVITTCDDQIILSAKNKKGVLFEQIWDATQPNEPVLKLSIKNIDKEEKFVRTIKMQPNGLKKFNLEKDGKLTELKEKISMLNENNCTSSENDSEILALKSDQANMLVKDNDVELIHVSKIKSEYEETIFFLNNFKGASNSGNFKNIDKSQNFGTFFFINKPAFMIFRSLNKHFSAVASMLLMILALFAFLVPFLMPLTGALLRQKEIKKRIQIVKKNTSNEILREQEITRIRKNERQTDILVSALVPLIPLIAVNIFNKISEYNIFLGSSGALDLPSKMIFEYRFFRITIFSLLNAAAMMIFNFVLQDEFQVFMTVFFAFIFYSNFSQLSLIGMIFFYLILSLFIFIIQKRRDE